MRSGLRQGGTPHARGEPARRFQDSLLFFTQWLRSPLKVAAVVPSGRDLATTMAAQVPLDDGLVVELGGGTGALTKGLLAHGVEPDRLVVIERDPIFHRILRERFPSASVLKGDAQELGRLLRDAGLGDRRVSAVVSGLPILTFPADQQERILTAAFDLMGAAGIFVQFTYGFSSPVPVKRLQAWGLTARLAGHALRNVPPAHVWCYKRAG